MQRGNLTNKLLEEQGLAVVESGQTAVLGFWETRKDPALGPFLTPSGYASCYFVRCFGDKGISSTNCFKQGISKFLLLTHIVFYCCLFYIFSHELVLRNGVRKRTFYPSELEIELKVFI